jgi:hypothetical protein
MEVNVLKLWELKERRGLSSRKLIALSGVNDSPIWRIEAGHTGAKPRGMPVESKRSRLGRATGAVASTYIRRVGYSWAAMS